MKTTKAELQESKEYLLTLLKPGDTVYTKLMHVSRSGMYRVIDMFVIRDNQPINISWDASKLLEGYDFKHEGCKAGGCGMDMGFSLVYDLSRSLFGKNWICSGEGCGANDHNNSPYPKRDGIMVHTDGGYALHQRWL